MALITTLCLFAAGILSAALSDLLADELKSCVAWLVQHIVEAANSRLPESQRERYREEWESHLDEVPGDLAKLCVALGFLSAARKMAAILDPPRNWARVVETSRRLGDLAMSCVLLVFFIPLLACLALAIRLESGGPVLVALRRVGLNGRRFRMYCFRTLTQAEPGVHGAGGGRLTRVGRFLRATNMDALPALFNVLRGDMRLVGRPPYRDRPG
jgi:hypothetical protein